MVERILLAASDEVAPERAEEHVERPDERPLSDRVAQRDVAQEPVRQHDEVRIRLAVDHEHGHGARRELRHRGRVAARSNTTSYASSTANRASAAPKR